MENGMVDFSTSPSFFPPFSVSDSGKVEFGVVFSLSFQDRMSVIRFSIVAAMNTLRGIGKEGGLPWRLSGDMKFFKNLTTTTTVFSLWMCADGIGRIKTERGNYGKEDVPVVSRQVPSAEQPHQHHRVPRYGVESVARVSSDSWSRKLNLPDTVFVCRSIDEALILTQKDELKEKVESTFVIGGGQIYREAIQLPECAKLYLTEVDNDVECDTYFPAIPPVFSLTVCKNYGL